VTASLDRQGAVAEAEAVRERDRRHVWHTWSPLAQDRARLMFARGEGHRVWDVEGREFIDAWSLNSTCGFAHPHVVAAVARQAKQLHTVDLSRASHELVGELAARLSSYLPPTMQKTLFVNSGSEGVEAATMIATSHWSHLGEKRSRIVAFERAYHGSTLLARSLSALPRVGHAVDVSLPVTLVEMPTSPAELRTPEACTALLEAFERAVESEQDGYPAAVLVEPFLNVGGAVVLPDGFLAGLRELCDVTGTLLVVDEVLTGYARSGRMFAFEHEGIAPDIVVTSKGIAGGYVPIATVTVTQEIHDSFGREPVTAGIRYGHTTSGHAIGCAAALATLDIIEEEDLPSRAAALGSRLFSHLAHLTTRNTVADVRSFGLIAAVELGSAGLADEVVANADALGLLVRQIGAVVLAVPPITIPDEGIDAIADRLAAAVAAVGA
jgi:adenosylmethionine-8-amino-7-oxononanoate aminotransferase